jgi:hypothetical protein
MPHNVILCKRITQVSAWNQQDGKFEKCIAMEKHIFNMNS